MAISDLIETDLPAGLLTEIEQDEFWMRQALLLADYAEQQGEVPVGAVLVKEGRLLSCGFNASIAKHDPSAHAEVMALRAAGKVLGNYRLPDTTLYVTLEPCAMCATALVHARVARLVYGAPDPRTGAAGSVLNLVQYPSFNHRMPILSGVLQSECSLRLTRFFKNKREKKRVHPVATTLD